MLGPDTRAVAFLARVLQPGFAVSALAEDGTLLGLAGVKTADGGLIGGRLGDLAAVYGWPGALWRGPMLEVLERNLEPGVLQMDGICVSPEARGRGVGTTLLNAVKALAAEHGATAVRLDVIDTNPRAEALYRREGFVPGKRESLGPLRLVFGFRSSLRMVFALTPLAAEETT